MNAELLNSDSVRASVLGEKFYTTSTGIEGPVEVWENPTVGEWSEVFHSSDFKQARFLAFDGKFYIWAAEKGTHSLIWHKALRRGDNLYSHDDVVMVF